MNMVTIQLEIPEDMKPYVNNYNKLRQNAILLYPYILDKTISHGRAVEILGISKLDLIDLYANLGFPYFDLTMNELDKDLETFHSLKGAVIWL